jgi:hypothetical protein
MEKDISVTDWFTIFLFFFYMFSKSFKCIGKTIRGCWFNTSIWWIWWCRPTKWHLKWLDYHISMHYNNDSDQLIFLCRHQLKIVQLSLIDDIVLLTFLQHIFVRQYSTSRLNVGRGLCVNERKRWMGKGHHDTHVLLVDREITCEQDKKLNYFSIMCISISVPIFFMP